MDQDRIIGVDNRIPWTTIDQDRKHFEKITNGKILVVGRNTFYERGDGDFSHLDHCRRVIVVSSSMTDADITDAERCMTMTTGAKVHLVRTFIDAVGLSTMLRQKNAFVNTDIHISGDLWRKKGAFHKVM